MTSHDDSRPALSPLVGESWRGGYGDESGRVGKDRFASILRMRTPLPTLPHKGGGGVPVRVVEAMEKGHSAASSIVACPTGWGFMSRIFTRAAITPLRPSSKVTSVRMSASFDPSYSAVMSGS